MTYFSLFYRSVHVLYTGIGVDGFVCFQNIYSYITTMPAVDQWHFHLCSATLYRIPCLKWAYRT